MKTRYKHIYFDEYKGEGKSVWVCCNNKSNKKMAEISWYVTWGKYVIMFEEDYVFDNTCLADVIHFLNQLKDGK